MFDASTKTDQSKPLPTIHQLTLVHGMSIAYRTDQIDKTQRVRACVSLLQPLWQRKQLVGENGTFKDSNKCERESKCHHGTD